MMLDVDGRLLNLRKDAISLKLPQVGRSLVRDTEYEHIVQLLYERFLGKILVVESYNKREKTVLSNTCRFKKIC